MADGDTSVDTEPRADADTGEPQDTDALDQPTGLTAGAEPQADDGGAKADDTQGSDDGKQATDQDKGADYEVKLPEGVEVPEERLQEFKSLVSEIKGLPESEVAQRLVDYQQQLNEQAQQEAIDFYVRQDKEWNEEAAKDPVIRQHEKDAVKLVSEEGDADLIRVLNETRLGNNPALRRFVAKTAARINRLESFIQDRIGEDPYAGMGSGSTGSHEPKSDGDILYPDMAKTG